MNLEIKQQEKNKNIQELKQKIEVQKLKIKKEEECLKSLKELYLKQKQSELPILLFQIADLIPEVGLGDANFYQNIYYLVDTDEVIYINEYNLNTMLPNTVDLRNNFEYINIPKNVYHIESYDFSNEVQYAVEILKDKIGNILRLSNIESWQELGNLLSEKLLEKSSVKVLKNTNDI